MRSTSGSLMAKPGPLAPNSGITVRMSDATAASSSRVITRSESVAGDMISPDLDVLLDETGSTAPGAQRNHPFSSDDPVQRLGTGAAAAAQEEERAAAVEHSAT